MLIQNQSKRTYELKVGVIRPLGVIEVPDGEAEAILKAGLGELVALEVTKPVKEEAKKEEVVAPKNTATKAKKRS